MLMMRLQRVGRRNDPSYRVVVTDKRTGPKSNKHVALIGSYNSKLNHIQIDADKAKQWLAQGVQPSPTVHNLLVTAKIIDAKKINVLPRKSPIIDEAAEAAKAEAEAAAKKAAEEAVAAPAEATEEVETVEEETPAETEVEAEKSEEEAPEEVAKV